MFPAPLTRKENSVIVRSMERAITPEKRDDDLQFDATLRPRSLADYIGQEKIKENMQLFIDAAKGRGEALDHVLL